MKIIKNKTILITGASSGIGKACAQQLAKANNTILLVARSADRLEELSIELKKHHSEIFFFSVDLADDISVESWSEMIRSKFGAPDILINCAGAGRWLTLEETPSNEIKDLIDSPLRLTMNVCKAFIADMVKRNSGQIIALNSIACYFSFAGATGYIASRAGLLGFMNALYEDNYLNSIQISSLVAGKVDSPYFTSNQGSAERIPKIALQLAKTMSVNEVAEKVEKLILKPKKVKIIPFSLSIVVYLNRFFPAIVQWMIRKSSFKNS